jgi:hypothetical protein
MISELPVSVVIASLGTEVVRGTIDAVLNGTRIPEEIILSVPHEAILANEITPKTERLKIVRSQKRGQVAQRSLGLRAAKASHVMQMDDDVQLEATTLQRLWERFPRCGVPAALSPLFCDSKSGCLLTTYPSGAISFLKSAGVACVYGAPWGKGRMGKISASAVAFAVDPAYFSGKDLCEVEWLPGGCVLCRRADAIAHDYYPFEGKAYSEDVLHSILWRQQGVKLFVAPDILCKTLTEDAPLSLSRIRAEFRSRSHIRRVQGRNVLFCRLVYLFWLMRLIIQKASIT